MTLAEKIFTLRRKNGLSQDELANELGVSRQAVYKWESGISTPEIDKIRTLSKLFKVSFDYLLDDEIDDLDVADSAPPKKEQTQVKYRTVYCAGGKQIENQSSVDHGFIGPKRDVSMAEAYFSRRMKAADKALTEAGASEIVYFKPTETTAWFYDDSRRAIGFYFGGMIRLVCPVENILSFNVYGGGQTLYSETKGKIGVGLGMGGASGIGVGIGSRNETTVVDKPSKGVLAYYDNGNVKEFEIVISPNDDYMIETVAVSKGVDFMHLLYSRNREAAERSFDALKQRIETAKVALVAEESGAVDINPEYYGEFNKKLFDDYTNFKNRILNPKAYVNQKPAEVPHDPTRIKLDQTVPKKEESAEENMLKIPLIIMGAIVAIIFIALLWFT